MIRTSVFNSKRSINRRQLACAMRVLFWLSLLPLVLIALYNYPADDDFGFVYPVATAWVQTGSLWQTLKAAIQKTYETYMTWQGDFFSTLLFCFTPMVFDINLYFLDNWAMLALLCLSVGYMVKSFVICWIGADKTAFWLVYSAMMVLVLQFMPSISYSVFWHNGGQYTTAACTLMLLVGLFLRCECAQTCTRGGVRMVCVAMMGIMLGGSFFGPALGALVLTVLWTLKAWVYKSRGRWHSTVALVFFASAFLLSVLAPGNAIRQERTGESTGALVTIITAVLDSFDLVGTWMTPQLLAMLMLIVPVLWKPLKESRHHFRHPLWIFVILYGLFSASLAPGIYTGFGYDTARYMNVIYFYFLIMIVGSVIYFEGALIRWLEHEREQREWAHHLLLSTGELGKRFCVTYMAAMIFLTAMGGFGYTIMNTSSVSALKSLVTGEAKQFRQEMYERQEYIRVTDSDMVSVQPLSVQPYVFKNDRLPWQGIYGRVRYMKWYFELFYNAQQ